MFFNMGVAEVTQILLQAALYMYTCTFYFPKFHSALHSALSESRISLWSMRIKCGSKMRTVRQPSL